MNKMQAMAMEAPQEDVKPKRKVRAKRKKVCLFVSFPVLVVAFGVYFLVSIGNSV